MNNEHIINAIRDYTKDVYTQSDYPALREQFLRWEAARPLAGIRVLDATPLYTNTLLKFIPLLAAGAEVTVATSDRIPYDAALPPILDAWGVPHLHNATHGAFDCILDCDGIYASLNPTFGHAELTRSGIYHYDGISKPVILVDDSRIKAIETCLGTGNGFLRAMEQLGHREFKGKSLVIFGYGKVGRGIAYYSHKAGAKITIVDCQKKSMSPEYEFIDAENNDALREVLRNAWCVVTAIGITNVMERYKCTDVLLNGTQLIAAMGVDDEWGNSLPHSRLLNQGKPLNFILKEPTSLCYIDPTMALHNAAAVELVTNSSLPTGLQKISPTIEDFYWSVVERDGKIAPELQGAGL